MINRIGGHVYLSALLGVLALSAGIGCSSTDSASNDGVRPNSTPPSTTTNTAVAGLAPDDAPSELSSGEIESKGHRLDLSTLDEFAPRKRLSHELPSTPATWVAHGPGPSRNGQVEGITNGEVSGAIHAVVAHPTDANILYIGSVNGGVWRTNNATAASPTWTPLTDQFGSLSIAAITMDPANSNVVLAGVGRRSSFFSIGGDRIGLLLTTDGGANWTHLDDALLVGQNISGVAVRGSVMLATSSNSFGNAMLRSTDSGATWTSVSGACCGLDSGNIFDLAGDPSNNNRFYAAVGGAGVFRSDDGGANWVNVSSNDTTVGGLNATVTSGSNNNTEISVASNGRVYVAAMLNGQAAYIGFSDDQGQTWTTMDLPRTQESNGDIEGLQPSQHPGAQGANHFSIIADPTSATTVYVGGDRQDSPFTNFVGANDFTGRLFRGDTTVAGTGGVPSPQWEHLTHSNSIAAIPGGGTANGSAPHADSRDMAFDANGNLIEVDDGGIYRRTNPANNTGDWFSINGNLQVTEQHDIAYDSNSNILLSGNQDTGSTEQTASGSTTWRSITTADGGDVAVDDTSTAGQSIRYSSTQNLRNFRRRTCDAANNCGAATTIAMNVTSGPAFVGQFVTPIALHRTQPTRLLVGGSNGVYESSDQGANVAQISANSPSRSLVYGHPNNAELIYFGSGSQVFVRTTAGGTVAATPTAFPGGTVVDIVVDPANENNFFAADSTRVYQTTDGGNNWTDITGNLRNTEPSNFQTLEYIEDGTTDKLVVGTNLGVFMSVEGNFDFWSELGTNLPNAPVHDLDYDAADDVLAVATLGRGAWTLSNVSQLNAPPVSRCKDVSADADGTCHANVAITEINDGSMDPDGDAITCVVDNAGPYPLHDTLVVLTCTDSKGASSSCHSTIKVVDTTPPSFVSVPPPTVITDCTSPNIGQAVAVDNCTNPPFVTNDAPSKFPLGPTVVTWTASDDAGNSVPAIQNITAILEEDPSCCPNGTNIIEGTSNADVLLGTTGSDCILLHGGNDVLNSMGGGDFISGGPGIDTITSGLGDDYLNGGPDFDICFAPLGVDNVLACELAP